MKTVICCAVCVVLTVATMIYLENSFFKKREVQRIVEADKDLSPPFGAGPLVSVVWYKGTKQAPYKIFSYHRDIENIRYRLQYKGAMPTANNQVSDFARENRLAFVYYSDKENSYRMTYIPFRIENDVFYWPYGEDKKIARILMSKEKWDQPFDHIDPSGIEYLSKEKKIEEKLGIEDKNEKINRIRKPLALKDQMEPNELALFETCNSAQQNLEEIVGFSLRAELFNDFLLELNKNELSEKLVHAFVRLPAGVVEDYSGVIKPEFVERIREFSKKYNDEGLNREEQIELFQIHQKINKQILDELQRRQDDIERILRITKPEEKIPIAPFEEPNRIKEAQER